MDRWREKDGFGEDLDGAERVDVGGEPSSSKADGKTADERELNDGVEIEGSRTSELDSPDRG